LSGWWGIHGPAGQGGQRSGRAVPQGAQESRQHLALGGFRAEDPAGKPDGNHAERSQGKNAIIRQRRSQGRGPVFQPLVERFLEEPEKTNHAPDSVKGREASLLDWLLAQLHRAATAVALLLFQALDAA